MIVSKQNQQFKLWKKLKTKKYRDLHGQFLVYGEHLIEAAQKTGHLEMVITSNPNKGGTLIAPELMEELQQTETFIDVIGLCKKVIKPKTSKRILALDQVQDPDNVGALLRSAAAFGFEHVILSHHSADLYNEKTIRASKGAIFHCYVERGPLGEKLKDLKTKDYLIIGADAHQGEAVLEPDKMVLVLGNEGQGIASEIKALCDTFVTIETITVESLNVSVAGGILMYEWSVKK